MNPDQRKVISNLEGGKRHGETPKHAVFYVKTEPIFLVMSNTFKRASLLLSFRMDPRLLLAGMTGEGVGDAKRGSRR